MRWRQVRLLLLYFDLSSLHLLLLQILLERRNLLVLPESLHLSALLSAWARAWLRQMIQKKRNQQTPQGKAAHRTVAWMARSILILVRILF